MATKRKTTSSAASKDQNKMIAIVIIAIIAFLAGFVIARARYKTQLLATYNMVMDRENTISDLQTRMKAIENEVKMQTDNNSK